MSEMSFVLIGYALALSYCGVTAAEEGTQQRWVQDTFLISFWVGPLVPIEEIDGRFQELSEAGFTGGDL